MRYLALGLLIFSSCGYLKPKATAPSEIAIAKVMDQMLYPSDLEGLISGTITTSDSQKLAEKYVADWVKKQLMIASATEAIDVNEAEIERRVLDYRYALIVHSFEKNYIDQNLDQNIDSAEINVYYQAKADNFLLKQNIIKCAFIQVPKSAPNLSQFRRNLKEYASNKDEIIAYAGQFATKSFLEDSVWINFDEIAVGSPLEAYMDKGQFIRNSSYSETSDQTSNYFLLIFDYKLIDEVSPLEFIHEDIRNIILNKRKITLKRELEEKIYEDAKNNDLFEIYTD